jgi:hypothetical protein
VGVRLGRQHDAVLHVTNRNVDSDRVLLVRYLLVLLSRLLLNLARILLNWPLVTFSFFINLLGLLALININLLGVITSHLICKVLHLVFNGLPVDLLSELFSFHLVFALEHN